MIALTTAEIAELTGGTADTDAVVTGVARDSRAVRPGDLFVALSGDRAHGVAFLDDAFARGAAAALVPEEAAGERLIRVADPLMALGRIAAAVRDRSPARVVGITGSTGKTTTKDILRALVEPHATVVASRENENNELGVPLTVCAAGPDTGVIVAEMAMRGIGQIAYLAEIVRPDVAVITSIGPVHLEFLGTVEQVAEAKSEILHHVAAGGAAVVPDDEPLLVPHLAAFGGRIVTFGEGEGADVRLAGFRRSGTGGEAEISLGGRTLHVPVNFASRHDARNLAAAAAAYALLDLPLDGLAEGAGAVRFSRWRGELIDLPDGGLLIADCYNANPDSMRAALAHLVEVADGRRTVAVLGSMAELGPTGEELHREVGATAARSGIDLVIGVGELARGYGGTWFADRDAALAGMAELLAPADAVLVKGSRSMGLEAVVEAIAP